MCFQPLGEPKNAEKRPSSADETQKARKNAHRRSTKCKKREKVLVVGRRNAKNAEKCPSLVDETRKIAFRRGATDRKREKSRFVGVRRTENAKNRVS